MHQYTDSLLPHRNRQTKENSLLPDIIVFNEYDSTKLEDWLMDIETAADVTSQS